MRQTVQYNNCTNGTIQQLYKRYNTSTVPTVQYNNCTNGTIQQLNQPFLLRLYNVMNTQFRDKKCKFMEISLKSKIKNTFMNCSFF